MTIPKITTTFLVLFKRIILLAPSSSGEGYEFIRGIYSYQFVAKWAGKKIQLLKKREKKSRKKKKKKGRETEKEGKKEEKEGKKKEKEGKNKEKEGKKKEKREKRKKRGKKSKKNWFICIMTLNK